MLILAINEVGEIVKAVAFGGDDYDGAADITTAPGGGYFVAGETGCAYGGSCDAWLLRLNESLEVTWQVAYNAGGDDAFGRLISTRDGELMLAGVTSSSGQPEEGMVVKLDMDGRRLWQRSYGGPGRDLIHSLQEASGGGCLVGAVAYAPYGTSWVMKLNADGGISEDCPAGIGEEMTLEPAETAFLPRETAFTETDADLIAVESAGVARDPGPVELETECVGW